MNERLSAYELGQELIELKARFDSDDEDDELDLENLDRLKSLMDLDEQIDLAYCAYASETFIPCFEFKEYAQELAEDDGTFEANAPWPRGHIDWEGAVKELLYDYTEVTFEGTDYYIRYI